MKDSSVSQAATPPSRPSLPCWARASIVGVVGFVSVASPASAQWTRVGEVPVANIYSVWANGDTIAAGSDSTAFVSLDAGAHWIPTAKVSGATSVEAVRLYRGRLYAGAFSKGVFVSSDMGATWQSFNQGLTGGFADQQLNISDLLFRGDTLYAATWGDGAWIRNLTTGTWSLYGDIFAPAQATYTEGIASSGTRLVAATGNNGDVYFRDPGQPDWTLTWLQNDGPAAGLAATSVIWTGHSWLVGTNIGVFHSTLGQSPWTYTDFGLRPLYFTSFALRAGVVFTHFANGEGTGIEYSRDDGVTWHVLEAQPATYTYAIATAGKMLYAARVDGLWRRSIDSITAVSDPPDRRIAGLHFAIVGPRPVRDQVRFRFVLPVAGRARIEIFDVSGRRVSDSVDEALPAGVNEVEWNARALASGVYLARLRAAGRSEVIRLVRVK